MTSTLMLVPRAAPLFFTLPLHARWLSGYCTAHKEIIKLTHFSQIKAAAILLKLRDSMDRN